jgi:putative addiction module CopG family antidote
LPIDVAFRLVIGMRMNVKTGSVSTPELDAFIAGRIAFGCSNSASEVARAVLRLLEDARQRDALAEDDSAEKHRNAC